MEQATTQRRARPAFGNRIYLHKGQEEVVRAPQRVRMVIAGRGWGKTTCVGAIAYDNISAMPGSNGFIAGVTYDQVLNKSLPLMKQMWATMGLKEDLHYVIGKRPPRHFQTPLVPPKKWANTVTWVNGSTIMLISLANPDLSRGGNFQWGVIDEAALVKKTTLTKVILAAMRGHRHRFGHKRQYRQLTMITSCPWKTAGQHVFDYEDLAESHPEEYFFKSATAHENIAVLGEDYFDSLEREMPYLEYQVEVLNRRIRAAQVPFYHRYDEERHGYMPSGNNRDADPDDLLDVSFDMGGWINCCTAWQQKGRDEYMRSQHFVLDKGIDDLIQSFCEYYSSHKNKWVRVWGDPRGHDKTPAGTTWYELIERAFTDRGWRVTVKVKPAKRTRTHDVRHTIMNTAFSESDPRIPRIRINEHECKDAMMAMKLAEKKPDGTKDKKSEKDRAFAQEHATHFTDTVDYYYTQKHADKLGKRSKGRAKTATTR